MPTVRWQVMTEAQLKCFRRPTVVSDKKQGYAKLYQDLTCSQMLFDVSKSKDIWKKSINSMIFLGLASHTESVDDPRCPISSEWKWRGKLPTPRPVYYPTSRLVSLKLPAVVRAARGKMWDVSLSQAFTSLPPSRLDLSLSISSLTPKFSNIPSSSSCLVAVAARI